MPAVSTGKASISHFIFSNEQRWAEMSPEEEYHIPQY